MGMNLQWKVLRSQLPPHLKPLAVVLALIAKDDGTNIWIRTERLAELLSVHRVTISKLLKELRAAGVVVTERQGGRWRTKQGKVVGRATVRRIDINRLESIGRSDAATWSPDLVATPLPDDSDHVASPLLDAFDHVAARLRINPGTYSNPGTYEVETPGTEGGKPVGKTVKPAASPTVTPRVSTKSHAFFEAQREKTNA